jgi:cell division protein FtsX
MEEAVLITGHTPVFAFFMQMIYAGVGFFLAWWAIRLLNWSTKTDVKNVLNLIYSQPLSAAIYRVGVLWSIFYFLGKFVR